jgi:SanA protein
MMKAALMKAGIPESVITLDYAGFRTLDSVVRAKEVFSLTGNITLISQPFHVERALFIAKYT